LSSTAAVYGHHPGPAAGEDAPTHPVSPYGYSKLVAEWFVNYVAAAEGAGCAILRYFNVAGGDGEIPYTRSQGADANLLTAAIDAGLGLCDRITVFGTDYDTEDGTCVRDFVHAVDVAEAHVQVLRRLIAGAAGGVLNCGYGSGVSVRQVRPVPS